MTTQLVLSAYQVHCLIKAAIPTASTVYERENPQGQMTIEEYLSQEAREELMYA
jgi:hypothetical protein